MVETNAEFAGWCVMTHARPILAEALTTWGLNDAANAISKATSLGALKSAAAEADVIVRERIRFGPLSRDLCSAANTLLAAITFAARGDAENTAVVVIGVFTNAARARLWRRPWQQISWRQRRADVIATVRREQREHRAQPPGV